MEDRKTRIAKLSERFKPQTGRQKLSPKQRERKSYYLDTEITGRMDRDYKEFSHQLYPQTVGKSVFMETILEYGLDNLPAIRELILEKLGTDSENE